MKMGWTRATILSAVTMACLLFQYVLTAATECPSNCRCNTTNTEGTKVALHCRGFPETFIRRVVSITLADVNTTELDISLLDRSYGGTLLHLNMSQLRISKITSQDDGFSLPKLETLELAHNHLLHLSANTFSWCQGLVELVMNDNTIKEISKDAFVHLPNLTRLNLANNNLLNVTDLALPQSLVSLDLCNNYLEQIPSFASSLPNLVTLSISGNEYSTVSADAFRGLPKLFALNLGDSVQSVKPGSLSELGSLRSLKLTGKGDIGSIAGREIQRLPDLHNLDLSFFTFPTITKSSMRELQSLQVLRLIDINSTGGFEDGVFDSLTRLTLLDLSRSQALVASLLQGIQRGLVISSLESLLLSEVNISLLSTQVLKLAPNLKYLDVSNNPIVCDNKWQELLQRSFVGEFKFQSLSDTVCAEPKSLFGKQLMDFSVLHEITEARTLDENDNSTSVPTTTPAASDGIYHYLDLWGITTDDLLYIILGLGIGVVVLLIAIIIVACCKSKKSRCYCNSTKEGSAESFMMRANSEYTFDNFTLSETMAECQRGTLSRNGKMSARS